VRTKKNRAIGQWGEEIAADFLERKGYSVLSRNVFTAGGEIDIVAFLENEADSYLVFVEVKTRTNNDFGYPEEAFDRKKYNHLLSSIEEYLDSNPGLPGEWRIDVIAVVGSPGRGKPQICHFEGIVMPDERE